MTRPGNDDSCPVCGTTSGVVQLTSSPRVQAWRCTACSTGWACTRVGPSPQPYLDQLAATVELRRAARAVLTEVTALAEQAATLTDEELRQRLTALADRADRATR
ncbi:MAG: hypothetical protein ACRDS1_04080 [Pseudonocardiaceae bacterium]